MRIDRYNEANSCFS